jgi:hypothetical protein
VTRSENICLQPSNVDSRGIDLSPKFLAWLAQLVREQGSGEYHLHVRPDGRVTVKRPRPMLQFSWERE